MASAPETRGTLGKMCLEDRYQGAACFGWRELFQIKFGRLTKISDRILDGFSLADHAHFRAFGHVEITFFVQCRRKRYCARHGELSLNCSFDTAPFQLPNSRSVTPATVPASSPALPVSPRS